MASIKEPAAPSTTEAQLDVVQEIILDHNNIRDLYQRYVQAKDIAEKQAIANTFVREIAVHGEAEEISVYRRMDQEDMKGIADTSRHEHQELEEALYEFDQTSIEDQPAHDQRLKKAFKLFQEHAEEEETDILHKLQSKLSQEMTHKLAVDFLQARQAVPHRPHPSAPQTGGLGQKLLGMLTKPVDLAVEQTRSFVDVRYEHPANSTNGKAMRVDRSLLV